MLMRMLVVAVFVVMFGRELRAEHGRADRRGARGCRRQDRRRLLVQGEEALRQDQDRRRVPDLKVQVVDAFPI